MAYAALGTSHYQLLIAHIILASQGCVSLIFVMLYATCHEQAVVFGTSWFSSYNFNLPIRLKGFSTCLSLTTCILIAGSIVSIIGGTSMLGLDHNDPDFNQESEECKRFHTAAIVLFTVGSFILIAFAFFVFAIERIRNSSVVLIMMTTPFFLVRMTYYYLSAYVPSMNVLNMSNYTETGVNTSLVIYENVLAIAMEFIICALLTGSFLCSPERPAPVISEGIILDDGKTLS